MAASKPLILLKGIGGLAATSLATLGGMEVGYKFLSSKTIERTESEEGSWDIEFEPEEYSEEIRDLRIPSGCDETCELTAEELRGLRFESRNSSSILFDGLTETDTFELAISGVSGDSENYPRGKKYTLKAKATTGTVTIKNVKGDDIVLGEEGVDLRETREGGRLEKIPEEVNDLGIPKRCEGDQDGDSTQTCELTREQLQRLKFEPKDSGGSISVSGLKDNERVELTISSVSEDNYPKGKKYTLKSTTRTVTIKGVKEGDVVLEENKGVDFREKSTGNQLETIEDSLGIPRRCSEKSCQLTEKELQRLKFETGDENTPIEVDGLDESSDKVELKVETITDPTNYPKGKKYTLKAANREVTIQGVKGGDIEIGGKDQKEVVIREKKSGGKLEKAPEEVTELGIPKRCVGEQATKQTCQLTKEQLQRFKFEPKGNEEITVYGLTEGNKVTLEIEDKNGDLNYPKGKKYTLKSTTGTVTIRNVKEGDITITKEKQQGVLIRETGRGGKLEEVPVEVDGLGIPTKCTPAQPCKLTKDQLQKLKFETRSSSSISISGLSGNETVDLAVEKITDKTNYPKGKKYTLKATSGKVTIKGLKDGDIVLESNQVVVIREKQSGGLLEKGEEEVNALGIPGRCISKLSCELTKEQLQRLKFETNDNSPIQVTGLGIKDRVTLKVDNPNDKTNYPKERRYSFKVEKEGVIIKNTKDGEIVLEKDKELLVREKPTGGKLETLLDSLGIPRSCNANEVKKGSAPQTCQLTKELLKNIKFKAFGGKRDDVTVTGLDATIKLTISWTEDRNYPGNIKYSFDNEVWRSWDIKITRGVQNKQKVTILIAQKKESWFKNEGGQLELVEAKTKSQVKIKEANEILGKLGLEKLELKNNSSDFDSFNSDRHNHKETSFYKDDELKKIKFKELGGGAEDTDPSGLNSNKKIKVSLDWDKDTEKYPYNMKITFQNDNFDKGFKFKKGENSVEIVKNVLNTFKVENQDDKWYLVKSN